MSRNWLITGVSSGIGRSIAKAALAEGGYVVGTLRKPEQAAEFESLAPGRAIALQLDVTDRAKVAAAIPAVLERIGSLDVLVNNAGYGMNGALEELSDEDIDRCIATNLVAPMTMIRAVLPHMRERRRGDIINVSSISGFIGYPGITAYTAAKFGLSGFSESLAKELAPFGIRVMVVEPGAFRTRFAQGSLVQSERIIEDYANTPAGFSRKHMASYGGTETGDPDRLAATLVKMLDGDELPISFVAGPDAVAVRRKVHTRGLQELDRWGELGCDVVFNENG